MVYGSGWSKRKLVIIASVISIIVVTLGARALRSTPDKNLIEDVPARWGEVDDLHRRAEQTLIALRQMPAEQHQAYLEQNWPTLDEDLVHWLHEIHGLTAQVDSVVYKFGSDAKAQADDATGEVHTGYISDELVALVYYHGQNEPRSVAIRCLNQLFELEGAELTRIGVGVPVARFTIARGEGLTRHVDYFTAIDLAEKYGLKLYLGRRQVPSAEIDFETARATNTDLRQVTVHVVEGDQFDLAAGVFTPSPLRQRR